MSNKLFSIESNEMKNGSVELFITEQDPLFSMLAEDSYTGHKNLIVQLLTTNCTKLFLYTSSEGKPAFRDYINNIIEKVTA